MKMHAVFFSVLVTASQVIKNQAKKALHFLECKLMNKLP